MDFVALPVLLLALWKMEYRRQGFREDGLSLENTRALKGLLALLVVLHHLYQRSGGLLLPLFDNVGVLCVSLFFFLSGYGLQKSCEKNPAYRRSLLRRRIPSVLVPYLCLTLIYWLFSGIMGHPVPPGQVLTGLLRGRPLDIYSWYIPCILYLYLGFWISLILCPENRVGRICLLVLACLIWVTVCRKLDFCGYWYNAVVLFPAGSLFALLEHRITGFWKAHYIPALAVSALGFCIFFPQALFTALKDSHISLYWPGCCCFVALTLLLMMKFRIHNPALLLLGDISFEIYGIHGLFLRLYRSPVFRLEGDALWGAAVLVSSVCTAWVLHRLFRLLLKKLLP